MIFKNIVTLLNRYKRILHANFIDKQCLSRIEHIDKDKQLATRKDLGNTDVINWKSSDGFEVEGLHLSIIFTHPWTYSIKTCIWALYRSSIIS
jgi:hypothetical protein